jgi:hypothetical protein
MIRQFAISMLAWPAATSASPISLTPIVCEFKKDF